MSNKEKIAELEDLISAGLDLIGVLNSKVNLADIEVDKLKKEDEVKPVFPTVKECDDYMWIVKEGDTFRVTNPLSSELPKLTKSGQTFRNCEDAEKELSRMQSRAYVIEAINKANGGLNGFIYGKDNYFYTYRHQTESIDWFLEDVNQQVESGLFCRNLALVNDEEFKAAYKIMLGIK